MEYYQHTLRNGLRIIHHPSNSKVAYCGFAINAGTRDELGHEHGMAHFVEHLIFKGTKTRNAMRILNWMEAVGGELNAYTNKEETVIYSVFLSEDFRRAITLLGDIVFHSIFPENEIRKEAEVIVDEIRSFEDNPSELIFDDFEDLIFRDHPLGHNILGDAPSLKSYTRQHVLDFTSRYYHPSNMVLFIYGNIRLKPALQYIEQAFGDIPDTKIVNGRVPPPTYRQDTVVVSKATNQAHVMLGCRAYNAYDERRTALYLLNNILGGPGMNSRLNVSLRERKGLVYTVESNLISYTDTGMFSIYFGTDKDHIKRCLRLIATEMNVLRDKKMTPGRLEMAKRQLIGQIAVASDNNENMALGIAKTFLHYNKYESQESVFERIKTVTAEQLQEVANDLLDIDRLTMLCYK